MNSNIKNKEIPEMKYIIEKTEETDRVAQFLKIFAAILQETNYRPTLEQFIKVSAKCAKCTTSCQVFENTKDVRDIPCYRSELLLSIYRRYFSLEGSLYARLFGGF